MTNTPHKALVAAGCQVEPSSEWHAFPDIHTPDTETARRILADFPKHKAERFRNQINGEWWLEVPFMFEK